MIPGGLALEQTVQVQPEWEGLPHEEFKAQFHGLLAEGDSPEQIEQSLAAMMEVRGAVSARMGELARQIHGLIQEHDTVHRNLVWTNGYIRDRRKELDLED